MHNFPENKRTAIIPSPLKPGEEMEVVLLDLSVSYLHRLDTGEIIDGSRNALLDASNLKEEQIDALRYGLSQELYKIIIELTFGKKDSDGGEEDEKK